MESNCLKRNTVEEYPSEPLTGNLILDKYTEEYINRSN
jgi:hypothetical protein